eukprot:TRINITY_DN18308_c0_g1_i1.p1 TRINITY_DN18308_c0_g1~~TRINITY_DN18308_c0_g1_i1.p1  ORF type:complete len:306 (+),score=35.42 TRINITY_DN18308_c0_g1_i1:307-1224(+)
MVNAKHELKIINLNSAGYDISNFYLIQFSMDYIKQLKWLELELFDAYTQNLSVIIQGHIPVSDFTAQEQWSIRYHALIEAYSPIIKGQFFGHTHKDEFTLMRNPLNKQVIGVQYISPSLTTWKNQFPSLRILEFNQKTNNLINILTYRLNLIELNANQNLLFKWTLSYDFLSEYDIKEQLTNNNMENFVQKLQTFNEENAKLMQKYIYNFETESNQPLTYQEIKEQKTKFDLYQIYLCKMNSTLKSEIKLCAQQYTTENIYLLEFTQSKYSSVWFQTKNNKINCCLLYTSPSPRDRQKSRMPSSA